MNELILKLLIESAISTAATQKLLVEHGILSQAEIEACEDQMRAEFKTSFIDGLFHATEEQKKPPEGGESKGADEWEEFEKVCRPVVEFLQKRYCTPHHRVIIDWSSAVLIQEMKSIGFKVPD